MRKLFLLLLLSIACNNNQQNDIPPSPPSKSEPKYSISVGTEPADIIPGEKTKLQFSIQADGKILTVNDLEVVHEKLLHLLIISEDLSYFDHLHPEQSSTGSFVVETKFPAPGKYRLYLDYSPIGAGSQLGRLQVNVPGPVPTAAKLLPDKELVKVVDGIRIELEGDKLEAAKPVLLKFKLTDEKTKKPVTDLEPYLGAFAHFVLVSEGHGEYLHAHPLVDAPSPTARGGPEVSTQTLFPKPGLYKLWIQFQRQGKLHTVSMVLDIASQSTQPATAEEKDGVQSVEIKVSKDGYKPAVIRLKKGVRTVLTFVRLDEQNCAEELLFPELDIKKKLPVGEPVKIELLPDRYGEIIFSCGMKMYQGKLLIVPN